MDKKINLGGIHLNVTAQGVDTALDKVNLLIEKLKEANTLLEELASMKVDVKFGENDVNLLND